MILKIIFWYFLSPFSDKPLKQGFQGCRASLTWALGHCACYAWGFAFDSRGGRFPACDVTFPKFHGFYMTVGHTHHATILLLFDPLPFHVGQMSVFVSGKYHDWFVHAICSGAIPNFCWVYRCIAIFSRLNQSFCCVKPGRTRQPQRSASCFGHFQLCRGVFFFSFRTFSLRKWGFTGIWQSRTCFRKKSLCLGEVCFAKVVPLARTHRNSGVWICNLFSYEIT